MKETWEVSREDPLEKGMATYSSILAWRISRTEEPGSYCPWGHKELDRTERLILSLTFKQEIQIKIFQDQFLATLQ